MRLILTLAVVVSGCSQAAVKNQQPAVAVYGQYSMMAGVPTPAPPAVCDVCGGKGVIGDGRVEVPCPQCRPKQETKPCLSGTCRPATHVIAR